MSGPVEVLNCLIKSLVVALVLTGFSRHLVNGSADSWNYMPGTNGGPEKWYIKYPDCGGVMQSPINIETNTALYDSLLKNFDFSDYKITEGVHMQLENVGGHTAEVIFSGKEIFLKGGSLPDKYRLLQFHFHWGKNNSHGSEHSLDGVFYPMEVHFVHYQNSLNATIAPSHPHGLAVIAFFFKIGRKNENYDKLLKYFVNITKADDEVEIEPFPIIDLLPPSLHYNYCRYHGSLTTPPCSETVIWSVATDVIELSESQIQVFRSLFDAESKQLVDDFRPIQKINQRRVLTTNPSTGSNSGNIIIIPQATLILFMFIYLLVL